MTAPDLMARDDIWLVILGLGVASFGLRFAFLGLVGGRSLPDWLHRHLRYTAVAVLPALVAPLVVWPSSTGGEIDPIRLVAAALALAAGMLTKSLFAAIIAGALVMVAGQWLWPML